MQLRKTIEEAHFVFPTMGSHPLLVTCDDFQDWVCKYDKSTANLFNELIAAKFAEEWDIKIPEIALINVKKEHVSADRFAHLQHFFFEKECFGSLHLKDSKEIDLSLIPLFKDKRFSSKLTNKEDFLKIALFDIWLANEDRNHNNFNMLLQTSSHTLNFLYAIDHVNIFNSSFLDYEIVSLTEEESIIKTELAQILFSNEKGLTQIVDNLVENFYLYRQKCHGKLDEILTLVPESWNIDTDSIKSKIIQNLFTEEWNKSCETNFREFIQSFIVNAT